MSVVTTYIGAAEAARLLGVTRPTLYAYVSRGIVSRRTAADGRTSLFPLAEVEALRTRSRRAPTGPRPTIDVQVASAITLLDEDGVSYRGHDVADLARRCTFEQVAELLWNGTLPRTSPRWPAAIGADVKRCRDALDAIGASANSIAGLSVMVLALGTARTDDDAAGAARRCLVTVPAVLGAPPRGDLAEQLACAWKQRPPTALVTAVRRALVLLADHELATSTLGVRVAASVRTDPYAAFVAGLAIVGGRLHGSAAGAVHALLAEAARSDPRAAIRRRLDAHERIPGFGHSIYRGDDPRWAPLMESVRTLADPAHRLGVVDDVLHEAGQAIGHRPNVDFGLGSLSFVADLEPSVPLFAIARLAGWAAHLQEELQERPLRFRGLARPR